MIVDPEFHARYGPCAVIAGATEGIGRAYAHQRAEKGLDLILIARREALLESEAHLLRRRHGVQVHTVSLDLAAADLEERFRAAIEGQDVGLLVYNACFSEIGTFLDTDLRSKLLTIDVNCRGPVTLTSVLAPRLVERGRGGIILISALNCLTPLEIDSVFQGTKAFILLFGESLWAEYRRKGVKVAVTLVNGIEGSESYENKLSPRSRRVAKIIGGSMPPQRIVASALEQFERDFPLLIPDFSVPINRSAVQIGLMVRMAKSRLLTLGASGLFGMLLDGDEVQAGLNK